MARWQLIVLVSIVTVVVAGCANVRQGVAWPDLELVTINEQSRVLVTYNDRIVAIDPYQGGQIHVARDADGEIIRNSEGEIVEWNINTAFKDRIYRIVTDLFWLTTKATRPIASRYGWSVV